MVSGLPKHTTAEDADEISEVIDATANGRRRYNPTTRNPDAARLMAGAVAHGNAALRWKIAAGAALQVAQIQTQTDPGPEADGHLRRAHAALDAAEADADLAAREKLSYQLRVWQARVDQEAGDD
jgi:hypothetical protein